MSEPKSKTQLSGVAQIVDGQQARGTPQNHIVIGNGTTLVGGMCAHMSMLAEGLAQTSEVHVWQPEQTELGSKLPGLNIHKTLGKLSIGDFRRTNLALGRFPRPRRLLVYWVPHAYGYKAMNVPFCIWIWLRAAWHKDRVELMVQECFLSFGAGGWRQDAAALVHRVMIVMLLRASRHVWVALTEYADWLRPYTLGRRVSFEWLPVPSNVAVVDNPAAVAKIRGELATSGFLVGHFGTFGATISDLIERLAPPILRAMDSSLILLGSGSEQFRAKLVRQHPDLEDRVHATGFMTDAALSSYLSSCDVMIQPYPDGITARRGSSLAPLAHGRPIVTNVSSQTEPLWSETGAVVLAELTPAAFLEAVRRLRGDSSERARLGVAARATYQRYFAPEHMVETIAKSA